METWSTSPIEVLVLFASCSLPECFFLERDKIPYLLLKMIFPSFGKRLQNDIADLFCSLLCWQDLRLLWPFE
jgi:hypothetical protein